MSTILGNPITLGGGGGNELIVTAPTGSTVTATKGSITKTATEKNGTWTFKGLEAGDWEIVATKGSNTKTITVTITNESAEIYYKPDFTYTGDWEWYNEEHTILKLKTSGTITFDSDFQADVFVVGGGGAGAPRNSSESFGGGGGGGYTNTKRVKFAKGTQYNAVIGAGGSALKAFGGAPGGSTSINGVNANGGEGGGHYSASSGTSTLCTKGGNGGSGGGSAYGYAGGSGGSDGANGSGGGNYGPGTGQGTTTRAFGDADGELFSGGGGAGGTNKGGAGGNGGGAAGGSNGNVGGSANANTGGGGGGGGVYAVQGSYGGGSGGSGVILIRF